jgi:hypothetical protein
METVCVLEEYDMSTVGICYIFILLELLTLSIHCPNKCAFIVLVLKTFLAIDLKSI